MKIYFWQTPFAWLRDKYRVGSHNFTILIAAIVPSSFVIIGLAADMITLKREVNVSNILLAGLIIYGIINLLIINLIQHANFRVKKERDTFRVIHKEIIERIRDYQAIKQKKELTSEDISQVVQQIIHNFNEQYMKKMYGDKVSITVKYKANNYLHAIRDGDDIGIRDEEPQVLNKAHVYSYLSKSGKKRQVIYVKNINNLDKKELKILGENEEDVRHRAGDKYRTFIALPIRTGSESAGKVSLKKDIGFICFDSKKPYDFGNIGDYQINIFACISDLLSEPLSDIIRLISKKAA